MATDGLDALNPRILSHAAKARKKLAAEARRVARICVCEWPLHVMRNGDGHHPDCPAHTPLAHLPRSHTATPPTKET